jgi:hypothetical protein
VGTGFSRYSRAQLDKDFEYVSEPPNWSTRQSAWNRARQAFPPLTSELIRIPCQSGTEPRAGSSSYRPETSSDRQQHSDLFDSRCRVVESLAGCPLIQHTDKRRPAATNPTIVPTVTRIPCRQGLPPMTSGLRVTRSISSIQAHFIVDRITVSTRVLLLFDVPAPAG